MASLTPHLPDTCSTYYELLGLSPFEGDARAIDARAKELMKEARKYQVGRFATQAEKHLNLLAEARGCLLDPSRKSKYDEKLRGQWELPPVTTVSTYPSTAVAPATVTAPAIPDFSTMDVPLSSRAMVRRAKRQRTMALLLLALATLLICTILGVLVGWMMASRGSGGPTSIGDAFRQVIHRDGDDNSSERSPGDR